MQNFPLLFDHAVSQYLLPLFFFFLNTYGDQSRKVAQLIGGKPRSQDSQAPDHYITC